MSADSHPSLDPEVHAYYLKGKEAGRLTDSADGRLEFERTQDILSRFLPSAPASVLDAGGGTGAYALWLARLGYRVHLIDPVELHVQRARNQSVAQASMPLASADVGDARSLAFPEASMDAVLQLGPLYHLPDPADRSQALAEARRVLRPGSVLFAAAISRFAAAIDWTYHGQLADPEHWERLAATLTEGEHRNPARREGLFTTSYFHRPEELEAEVRAAGFTNVRVLAVEGVVRHPGREPGVLDEFERNPLFRERQLALARMLEEEPSLLGFSSHLMAIGYRSG